MRARLTRTLGVQTGDPGKVRIRMQMPEPILADVIGELTRIGASVQDLQRENGTCTLTAMAPPEHVPAFERWLSIFSRGAVHMETLAE